MGRIDLNDVLQRPVEILKGNYDFFVPPLIPAVFDLVAGPKYGGYGFNMSYSLLIYAVSLILGIIASGALVYMAEVELNGKRASYREGLNVALERLGDLVIASLIIGVGFVVGLILLIVPGLLWLILTAFAVPLIILENMDGVGAVMESIRLVRENFSEVLVYLVVLIAIVFVVSVVLGLIPYLGPFVASLLVTPYVSISLTMAYHQLSGEAVGEENF
ncbi:DUF7544 domain-containing protein [Thermococcus sp.]